MFLHAGAGIHRHEFSTPPLDRSQLPKRPSMRTAFSNPIQRSATTYENTVSFTFQPQRPLSEHRPKSNPQEHIVRFQEPEVDRMSEDARSTANSDTSETTANGRTRRRRTPRTSTAYHLAHPAPTLATQKQKLLQVRPKLLLQLQRLSSDSRPKPAIDVLPSFLVVPRLSKKFPRIFRGKGELGANDVMVVKSEDYDAPNHDSPHGQDSDDEGLASRDLVAVICQMRKGEGGSQGCAEITLHDESVWTATPLPNGSFEFVTTDSTGFTIIARWVRKARPRNNGDQSASGSADYKYNFSLIDPNSRRHPIMASITQRTLDIPDFYTPVSRPAGKCPPTSPIPPTPNEPEPSLPDDEGARTTYAIDESTKTLIQVTGVWVALRQGWSPYFKYDDPMCGGATTNPRAAGYGRVRSLSLSPEASRLSPCLNGSASPDSSQSTLAIGKVRRSLNPITSRGSSSGGSPQMQQHTAPKRASSAGTAFMLRAVARRGGGNAPSAVASDSEGEGGLCPPKRTTTDIINQKSADHFSTPSLTLPESLNITPDTSTKPQRRVQSAFYPPAKLQSGHSNGDGHASGSESVDWKQASDYGGKFKTGRWKSFTNFFRRSNRHTSGSDDNGTST